VIEVFIDELDLAALGFSGMTPAATGRPALPSLDVAETSSAGDLCSSSKAYGGSSRHAAHGQHDYRAGSKQWIGSVPDVVISS
jgi:hypothetical protein